MGIERMSFSDFGPRYYEHVDPNISDINASCIVFLKFMHLHCCISPRYARCETREALGPTTTIPTPFLR
jgi:hypothetical protein